MKKKSQTLAMILLIAMLVSLFLPSTTFAASTDLTANANVNLLNASNADESQFSVTVNFEEPKLSNVQVQGSSYDLIQLGDCSYMEDVGKPMLPTKGVLVLLPPKMGVDDVDIVAEFETMPGQYNVYPVQPPVPADDHEIPGFVGPDPIAYASAADYPDKLYDQETIVSLRGYQMLSLRLFPVRYVGATNQIKFCRTMTITVKASTTDAMAESFKFHEMGLRNPIQETDAWVSEHVLNPEMKLQYEATAAVSPASEPVPAPTVDYLIITRSMFLSVLTTYPNSTKDGASLFIRSKKFSGLQVAVETLENIRTQYTGYDDAEKTRKCIQHYYTDHGLTYVLLLGDVENSGAAWYVPVRNMYNPDGESTYTPSDFYYAGLDGTWDADGDHYYGERAALSVADEADWGPEVYVGRITAHTTAELDTELNKVANFKGFSDSSITNMVLCGGISDSSTDEKLLKEYIRDNFVPTSVTVSELYASVGTLTESRFANVVNVHRPEVINSASHGSETSLNPGFFVASTTPALMKGPMYLWYADACLSASFDYSGGDCCGEAMMKDPDGGGMFIGGTRVTWYWIGYPGHLNGLNGKQDWLFWQNFFQNKVYDPGKCLYQSKVTYIAGGPDLTQEYERKNLFTYNLIGDPQARATCAKRGTILFDESHNCDWKIEKGQLYYDLATALRSVGYTVDSLQVHYGPSATITFDDLTNGQMVNRTYLGLNFSTGYTAWDSTGSLFYPPHSTPNVAYTHETSNFIIFDVPVDYVQAYFCAYGNYSLTLKAYDGAGNLIGSTPIPASSVNVLRSITNPWGKIKKLVVTGAVSGWETRWTIDDLYYSSNAYLETMWKYNALALIPGSGQTEYTAYGYSEAGYTNSFVSNGGGLCIIGENGAWMNATYINAIASSYGVTFQENTLYDPTNYEGNPTWVLVHTFPAAGDATYGILAKGLATVLYPSGSSLGVTTPATSVATGDSDSYTVASGSATAAGQEFGGASLGVAESPVPASYEAVMAAALSGSGRVFCVGDANIWDSQDTNANGIVNLYERDNLYLMYNIFDWLTKTRATRSVSVLVDQTHAPIWNVYYGSSNSISGLCDYLRHDDYGVYILKTGPITYSKLAHYDVFVLPLPTASFSANEIDAIKQYVAGGGHLWVIGDYNGYATVPNAVGSQFNIAFDSNMVTDPTDYQTGNTAWVLYYSRNFVHQITHGLTKLVTYAGSTLTLGGSASSAINTDSDASPASKSVMAVNTYGNGRVVVIGDSDCFTNQDVESNGICSIDEADNAQLALRTISWAPCLVNYQFPSPTSTVSLASNPYMWHAGDYVQQSFTWSYASAAVQLSIHFEVGTNYLAGDGYIPIDVQVNGAKVGEFTVTRGHNCIDKTFSLVPNPVNQGSFTIKYLETRTVDSGKGSITLDYTNSYIKLAKAEKTSMLAVENVVAWRWGGNTTITCVAAGDVDGDGGSEIVTGGYYYDGVRNVALLHVWNGSTLTVERSVPWFWGGNTVVTSLAVGDVDGDGNTEIVTGGYYFDGVRNVAQLHVWNGATLAVKKVQTWYWGGNTIITCLATADVDADGQKEIVTGGYYFDGVRNVALLHIWNGATLAVKKAQPWYWGGDTTVNCLAIGDLYGDGQKEIVTGGYYFDGTRRVAQLHVWNGSSLAVKGVRTWYWGGSTEISSVCIGDVDGDGASEIVTGGFYFDGVRNVALLHSWSAALAVEHAVPWFWGGDTKVLSVAFGDVDGDGKTEVVTGGYYYDGAEKVAQLHVWDGASFSVKGVKTWYWAGNTVVQSMSVGDVNGDLFNEIVTGGTFYSGSYDNAQLMVWSMA